MELAGIARCSVVALLLVASIAGCGATPWPAPSPTPSSSSDASPTPAASVLTREEAIEIARAAAPRYARFEVLKADVGRFADLASPFIASHMSQPPAPDLMVWRVTLGEQPSPTGGLGTDVFIDLRDGTVVLAIEWVS